MRHLPNLICLARIALIWPILAALDAEEYDFAFFLFAVAAVSDGLDGYLAKRFGWTSELGKFLDPIADKLLLMSVFVAATWHGLVPIWLTATAVARDLLIGAGAFAIMIWVGPLRGRPTVISKINTVVQLVYLLAVMAHAATGEPPADVLAALAVITLATTVISGIDYAIKFARRAAESPAGTP